MRCAAAVRSLELGTVLLLDGRDEFPVLIGGDDGPEGVDAAPGTVRGDLLRERRPRDLDRDRSRIDWVMAPKKERSVGETGDVVDEAQEVVGETGGKYDVGAPAYEGEVSELVDEVEAVESIEVVVILRLGWGG